MKKGFTLIELLAVIIILAIIALIATPIILNVIEDSKKSANRSQVELLLGGAEQYYAQGILNDTIFNSTENIYLKIETTNEKPENGNIKINQEGKISLAIYLDGVCYTKDFSSSEISEDDTIEDPLECVPVELYTKYNFDYTGEIQTFTALEDGYYFMEAWGAQGGSNEEYIGSYGAYTAGYIYLNKGETIYVQVGGQGKTVIDDNQQESGGYNGGSVGVGATISVEGSGSGGATDFRIVDGEWNDSSSLSSRIMVAAGGVGNANWYNPVYNPAPGGGLLGYDGQEYRYELTSYTNATGASQVSGGTGAKGYATEQSGTFGIGANASNHASGGSGGYYGGGCGYYNNYVVGSGSSGSSYISGHTGAVAIKSETDQTPKDGCTTGTTDNNCSIHYSGLEFINTIMIDGKGYYWTNEKKEIILMPSKDNGFYSMYKGHEGNGYARVTFIGDTPKEMVLNEVESTQKYDYTGSVQEIVLEKGTYNFLLAGAQGGTSRINSNLYVPGGKGSIVEANIVLEETTTLYAYIGGKGGDATTTAGGTAGYNGGGAGAKDSNDDDDSGAGGGATDIRLVSGEWNNSEGLNSRIIVSAGGGGGRYDIVGAIGGALTNVGIAKSEGSSYQFGIGGNGVPAGGSGGAGGGGGYFGGSGGQANSYSSSGGSSYISGYTGVKSVTSQTDATLTENVNHYSGYVFIDGAMYPGYNEGNGFIYITKLN